MSLLTHRTTLLARTASLVRTYAVSRPNPHPKDPVLNSPNANVQQITPDVTFIHNPPSSVPTPHSLTSAPASPLLSKPSRTTNSDYLPPELRPKPARTEQPRLTYAQMEEMRQLRLSNPEANSCSVLARKFGCSPAFVGMVAPLPKAKREEIETAQRQAQKKENWGERRKLISEIRKRRREFW